MTAKRFTLHIEWYDIDKTEGEAELRDNGQPLLATEHVEDARYLKDLLNEQHEVIDICENRIAELRKENKQLKATIKEAYQSERTMIGKSVLKQLMETIQ